MEIADSGSVTGAWGAARDDPSLKTEPEHTVSARHDERHGGCAAQDQAPFVGRDEDSVEVGRCGNGGSAPQMAPEGLGSGKVTDQVDHGGVDDDRAQRPTSSSSSTRPAATAPAPVGPLVCGACTSSGRSLISTSTGRAISV